MVARASASRVYLYELADEILDAPPARGTVDQHQTVTAGRSSGARSQRASVAACS